MILLEELVGGDFMIYEFFRKRIIGEPVSGEEGEKEIFARLRHSAECAQFMTQIFCVALGDRIGGIREFDL
jgi:hypothetical protein